MQKVIKLYESLCDYYNDNNVQRYCSLQSFLQFKYDNEKNSIKKNLILQVINYAANDYTY